MIQSITDITNRLDKSTKIIVLYSGGLDGTFLLTNLFRLGYKNLLALHADIGGGETYLQICHRLKKLNIKTDVLPLTDELIDSFLLNSIYSQAKYLGGHPLSASLSRPLIAKHAVEYIIKNNILSPVLLHTSNSSQNSLRRFNNSLKDLKFGGLYGSPFEKTHITRSQKIKYLHENGIGFDLQLYSEDSNIWCREFEYGDYDNVEDIKVPEESYLWTKRDMSSTGEIVTIEFEHGVPVAMNGKRSPVKEIILDLRNQVGKYGIGRYIGLEEIQSGEKVLEIREAPSASILMKSYKDIELATISSETARVKANIEQIWVREASEGRWFGSLRSACDRFCKEISLTITGSVSYYLSPNSFQLVSLKSSFPNYIMNRDEFEESLF